MTTPNSLSSSRHSPEAISAMSLPLASEQALTHLVEADTTTANVHDHTEYSLQEHLSPVPHIGGVPATNS